MNLLSLISIHHKILLIIIAVIAMRIAYFFGEKLWSYSIAAFFIISTFFENQIFGFVAIFPLNKVVFTILTFTEFAILISSLIIGISFRKRKWERKELLKIPIFAGLGTIAIFAIRMILK